MLNEGGWKWTEKVLQERKAKPILVGAKDWHDVTKASAGGPIEPPAGLGGSALDLVTSPELLAVVQAGLTAGWREYVTPLIKKWPRYPFRG